MNAQHLQHKHAKRIERLRRRLHQVAVIQEHDGTVEIVSPTHDLSLRAFRVTSALIRNTNDLDSFGLQLKVQPAIH